MTIEKEALEALFSDDELVEVAQKTIKQLAKSRGGILYSAFFGRIKNQKKIVARVLYKLEDIGMVKIQRRPYGRAFEKIKINPPRLLWWYKNILSSQRHSFLKELNKFNDYVYFICQKCNKTYPFEDAVEIQFKCCKGLEQLDNNSKYVQGLREQVSAIERKIENTISGM